MKLEHYSLKKLKKEIIEIFRGYLGLNQYRIFFFGSRVKGDNFPRADIDIGIEGAEEIPVKIKLEIEEELEKIPILYKFDFIDFKTVSSDFKKEALKYIEPID